MARNKSVLNQKEANEILEGLTTDSRVAQRVRCYEDLGLALIGRSQQPDRLLHTLRHQELFGDKCKYPLCFDNLSVTLVMITTPVN